MSCSARELCVTLGGFLHAKSGRLRILRKHLGESIRDGAAPMALGGALAVADTVIETTLRGAMKSR